MIRHMLILIVIITGVFSCSIRNAGGSGSEIPNVNNDSQKRKIITINDSCSLPAENLFIDSTTKHQKRGGN